MIKSGASLRKAGYRYDADKAIYWLKKAAEQEYRDAFWELSNLYHNLGQYEESVQWGFKAAERKDPYALLVCGSLCYNGKDGFPQDRDRSFEYLSYFLTLSLKKLPMLFCFNYQRLNYFV